MWIVTMERQTNGDRQEKARTNQGMREGKQAIEKEIERLMAREREKERTMAKK